MALLDVSKIINDPRFMDKLTVIRFKQTVNDKGRAENIEDPLHFTGVVTANDGYKLDRLPDGSMVTGAINVHTRYCLTAARTGRDADEICWRGKYYTVTTVNDYSHFGRGFVHAICTLKNRTS